MADRIAAETERKAAMQAVADDFEQTVGGVARQLATATAEMNTLAETLGISAGSSRTEAAAAAASAAGASGNVHTMASAANQMAASLNEISAQINGLATTARRSKAAADATQATIDGLAQAAGRIGDMVRVIGNLASRTNLLALNATIESARAGSAGKGFAVVAGEVKALAGQTTKATTEISNQVQVIPSARSRTPVRNPSPDRLYSSARRRAAGTARAECWGRS